MKKLFASVLASLLVGTALPAAVLADEAGPVYGDIHINPIEGMNSDFIKGADVSMLKQIEISGGKFYDNGVEKDALQILKDHGVNWVRLRVWNNPVDANGKPLGGGNNDKARTIEIAKRAKDLGLKVLLDFHYSDFWADPSKQNKPAAWVGLNTEQLQQALYDYTADVVSGMRDNGAMPDMVQIGNETNSGMVWPDGQTSGSGGYDGWANLVKQGVQAVRDNDPNNGDPALRTKIMIHLADGGDNALYRRNFDQLTARNVDFDIIGFSYYPYWHGTMQQLKANMEDIGARYHKQVLVAENAYAYTLDDADQFSNNFGPSQEQLGGYKATIQGQAQEVHDVMDTVAHVSGGLGVFYWEPDWIPVKGAEWSSADGEGNGWENQAMFDFNGNALPSLDVFNRVSDSSSGQPFVATATTVQPVDIHMSVGGTLLLPDKVRVEFTDDSVRSLPVEWQQPNTDDLKHPGTVTLQGTIDGAALPATAVITVQGATNYVSNAGFELGDGSSWTIEGDSNAVKVVSDSANAHNSEYALHYSLNQDMPFTVSQKITGLKNGTYTLKAWSQGGGGENSLKLFANGYGGKEKTADIVNTGWVQWKHPEITNIEVTNGEITIGVQADGKNGNWGNIDDFELYTDSTEMTITAPDSVKKGQQFMVQVGNNGLVDTLYAQDFKLQYDPAAMDFVSAQSADAKTLLLANEPVGSGMQRFIVAHDGGKSTDTGTLNLTFQAKSVTDATYGDIRILSAEWGGTPGSALVEPALLGSKRIAVTNASNGGNKSSGRGGASSSSTEKKVEKGVNGSIKVTQKPTLQANKMAMAAISADDWKQLIEAGSNSNSAITLSIDAIDGAEGYAQSLPASVLQAAGSGQSITINTPLGSVTVPADMLLSQHLSGSDQVVIRIGKVNTASFGESLKNQLGNKPVVDLSLQASGKTIAWNNADTPVTAAIPYTPTAEELQHPNHLTVWYINDKGKAEAIPNAAYDAESNSVVFTTHHFSNYAVAYVERSFADLSGYDWAKQAVESLASKGITNGTSETSFSPQSSVTRADFLVMLMRALGLSASVDANFTDVKQGVYYYEAVGAAKKLGIAAGYEDGTFAPNAPISREDLMVLTARALKLSKNWNPQTDASTVLKSYEDASAIQPYAVQAIAALIQSGVVSGNGTGLAPQADTSRAETAVIIYRALQLK
ncbi:glycosyl hydrolase 53 family protein [Paenibacillus hexagrammi]|uniref:Arabinogalactan endo-beta-1,4-galactanase n=1 Tax=Paenibacillus hexagrammi TaxID=2908839 RepID=A0ABY3SN11_9BACL|nr:glycosyl hydrolase 53 family protein [Paenibacillus sp. YPD9-1]UJF34925.1 glycosyl hydrolase 53 family protein [Paenibacillus sp. YPD9-1]